MSDLLAGALGVLVFVVGLVVSVSLHELGHFLPAKRFGVRVSQFMFGFGRTLWSVRRGETEYGIKAVPLGGYVLMQGMYAPARDGVVRAGSTGAFQALADRAREEAAAQVPQGEDHRSFYRLSVPKRLVIMLGGPLVNLLIAAVLLTVALCGFGVQTPTTTVAAVSQCVLPASATETTCPADAAPTPAAAAGLQVGDDVLSVAGTDVQGDWSAATAAIRAAAGTTVDVVVERDGERLVLPAAIISDQRPVLDDDGNPVLADDGSLTTTSAGFLGITPSYALARQPVGEVPGVLLDATVRTAGIVIDLPARMVGVAQAAFGGGERDPEGPIGVVGVGRISGEIATTDLITSTQERVALMISTLASVNLALFVFNLVPLLPLDGGHVAGALWEAARRRLARVTGRPDPGPFDLARLLPLTYAVAGLLVVMSVLLLYADIVNPVTLG